MIEAMHQYIAANGTAEARWYFATLAQGPILTVVATIAFIFVLPNRLGAFADWVTGNIVGDRPAS